MDVANNKIKYRNSSRLLKFAVLGGTTIASTCILLLTTAATFWLWPSLIDLMINAFVVYLMYASDQHQRIVYFITKLCCCCIRCCCSHLQNMAEDVSIVPTTSIDMGHREIDLNVNNLMNDGKNKTDNIVNNNANNDKKINEHNLGVPSGNAQLQISMESTMQRDHTTNEITVTYYNNSAINKVQPISGLSPTTETEPKHVRDASTASNDMTNQHHDRNISTASDAGLNVPSPITNFHLPNESLTIINELEAVTTHKNQETINQ